MIKDFGDKNFRSLRDQYYNALTCHIKFAGVLGRFKILVTSSKACDVAVSDEAGELRLTSDHIYFYLVLLFEL